MERWDERWTDIYISGITKATVPMLKTMRSVSISDIIVIHNR